MFGRSAEVANQYLRKGSKVLLEGRLIFEQWTAQDGTNRNRHSLRVETMKMLDSKSDSMNNNAGDNQGYNPQGSNNQPAQNQYNNTASTQNAQNNYGGMNQAPKMPEHKIPEIDIDEDEIPF